jgi:hypothetical protein
VQSVSPLGSTHHHVDVAAAALRADEPLAPLGNGGLGAVPRGDLRRVGLGPVTARLARPQPRCRASSADPAATSSAAQRSARRRSMTLGPPVVLSLLSRPMMGPGGVREGAAGEGEPGRVRFLKPQATTKPRR